MFDHAIYNDCMANVDYSEQMVKETNPSLLAKAEKTPAPHSDIHGYKTIADIMRALNAFTGSFYLETLQVARYTREMYCLFGGRHTHPSTILPGGCSADITQQTCTEYYVRLMRYIDYCKRSVPMHDDLYDFFYEALPGYERVGYRETDIICWGCFDDPDYVDYDYKQHDRVGPAAVRHAGPGLQGRADHDRPRRDQPGDPHPAGLVVLRRLDRRGDVRHAGPARQPDRQAPPVEQGDAAQAAGARLRRQVLLGRLAAHVRQAQRQLRRQRHRRRPVRPPVGDGQGGARRHRLPEGHRREPADGAAQDGLHARDGARVEGPAVVERDRAPAGPQLPPGVLGAGRAAQPGARAGRDPRRADQELERLQGARGGRSAWASTRPPAACSRTTWSSARARSPTTSPTRRRRGTATRATPTGRPGPYEDAVQNTPIFEENGPENFKGVDIMRAVHSFDPCLPCGVHMYGRARSARWSTRRRGWPEWRWPRRRRRRGA